ncbi:MAG: MBL fold metallo-hydrolase [Aestuariivirgaceae bacterium]|nr:MBL fold metallo-hydrolase [Aestuariivirgaceae bacterium]
MSIKLHFHGASRTVTGSSYVIETPQARVMVDCGMFQGSKTEASLNYRPFACAPEKLTAMLLTHAHIDHSGLIPKLVKAGFTGRIHSTAATADLCAVMLADSAHIQQMEVRNLNERKRRRGEEEVEPIYDMADAEAAAKLFTPNDYHEWIDPAPGMRARFWNAGHLLGSASIEVEVDQVGKKPLRILFSGDIGPEFKLLQPDPEAPADFDYVLCESTYGAKERQDRDEETRRRHLTVEVKAAITRGGVMLIPSFAVERTQELMTDLAILISRGDLPSIPVFIDSPLAMRASRIFEHHAGDLDHGKWLRQAFASPDVRLMESTEDSKSLNRLSGTYIIIAASGMCEAGRIRHHLKNRLWMPQTTVMLAGYQAEGTLGRMLESGARRVRIMGEEISVRAHITKIDDYSGHADGPELQAWVKARLPIARGIFLTHGEDPAQLGLAARLNGIIPADRIFRPSLDDAYELTGPEPVLVDTTTPRRLAATQVASVDWNNDLASLVLDLNEELRKAADEKTRQKIIRRLRRALEEG